MICKSVAIVEGEGEYKRYRGETKEVEIEREYTGGTRGGLDRSVIDD